MIGSTAEARDALSALVGEHRSGRSVGIVSVCSAHPLVLEATMREAAEAPDGRVLVEATSNQVDQFGGYTGMQPDDFRALVLEIAGRHGVAADRVILGGDHLGPNPWRDRSAAEAMELAEGLIEAYARAGYTKIHLDCSMACADDPARLSDEVVSERAVRLMAVAERAAPDRDAISYVIGTEVPVPGGAAETIDALVPTTRDAAAATLEAHRAAAEAAGLSEAWPRIRALVVQPGVEFDEWRVVDYDPSRTGDLQTVLRDQPGMVFEAHSTDYQAPKALAALVAGHWAILKVGPWLTFALREAMFGLEAIERELLDPTERSGLPEVLEQAMLADPGHWQRHYGGSEHEQRLARRYSFSDRLRYYWPAPPVQAAEERLLANLEHREIPLPLLSQYLPVQYARVREGTLEPRPRELALDRIGDVLRTYRAACDPTPAREAENLR